MASVGEVTRSFRHRSALWLDPVTDFKPYHIDCCLQKSNQLDAHTRMGLPEVDLVVIGAGGNN